MESEKQKEEIGRLLKRKGRLFGVDYTFLSDKEAENTIKHLKRLKNRGLKENEK